jgi:hypothetical protein
MLLQNVSNWTRKDEYTIGCDVTLVQGPAMFVDKHGLVTERRPLVVIIIILDIMNGK